MKYDKDGIMVEELWPSGGWNFSYRTPEGELVKMKYIGYTRKQALDKFKDLLESL